MMHPQAMHLQPLCSMQSIMMTISPAEALVQMWQRCFGQGLK
jgi:hypothetical protein